MTSPRNDSSQVNHANEQTILISVVNCVINTVECEIVNTIPGILGMLQWVWYF